jgi:hypothetical protein
MECCYVSVTSDGCKNINLLALYYQFEFLLLHHIISSFNSVFAIIVLIFHVLPHNQDEKRFTPSPVAIVSIMNVFVIMVLPLYFFTPHIVIN